MNIQTVKFKEMSFINVTSPGKLELKYLKNNFDFNQLHLDDYIYKTQIPKIEIAKNYSLIVLDFPYFNLNGTPQSTTEQNGSSKFSFLKKLNPTPVSLPLPQFSTGEKKKRILSSQIDFFVGKDYLVILHDQQLAPIDDTFSRCQKTLNNREEFMGQGPTFLAYRLIDILVDACFPVINELSTSIDKIDKELEKSSAQNTIEDISVTRRNIVVFQTMIKPMLPLFTELESGKYKELNGSMQSLWSNVLDH